MLNKIDLLHGSISIHHLNTWQPAIEMFKNLEGAITEIFFALATCNWVSRIFSSCQSWRREEGLFGRFKNGVHIVRSPLRALHCHRRWKSLSFCEIWNNSTPSLFLSEDLINKHCRTRSSMINLWIDSKTCQK